MNRDGAITLRVRDVLDMRGTAVKIGLAIHCAQMKLDAQVVADANYYCPLKTGTLQKSAVIGTVMGSGLVVWRTPYARKQYYGVDFDRSRDPNPNACARWFEAAKARRLGEWKRVVDEAIKDC